MSSSAVTESFQGSASSKAYGSEQIQVILLHKKNLHESALFLCFFSYGCSVLKDAIN